MLGMGSGTWLGRADKQLALARFVASPGRVSAKSQYGERPLSHLTDGRGVVSASGVRTRCHAVNIFRIHKDVLDEYRAYVRSFVAVSGGGGR
jgi:hypothetical protein